MYFPAICCCANVKARKEGEARRGQNFPILKNFKVRDFRRPIRLLLFEIRWGVGEWNSRGRQAELGELSMLWVIGTSPPIDLVGQGTGIPAELWWNCGLPNWNFYFSNRFRFPGILMPYPHSWPRPQITHTQLHATPRRPHAPAGLVLVLHVYKIM